MVSLWVLVMRTVVTHMYMVNLGTTFLPFLLPYFPFLCCLFCPFSLLYICTHQKWKTETERTKIWRSKYCTKQNMTGKHQICVERRGDSDHPQVNTWHKYVIFFFSTVWGLTCGLHHLLGSSVRRLSARSIKSHKAWEDLRSLSLRRLQAFSFSTTSLFWLFGRCLVAFRCWKYLIIIKWIGWVWPTTRLRYV